MCAGHMSSARSTPDATPTACPESARPEGSWEPHEYIVHDAKRRKVSSTPGRRLRAVGVIPARLPTGCKTQKYGTRTDAGH